MLTRKRLNTITSALRDLTEYLRPFSTTPRLDAELLMAHSLKRPRTFLYTYAEQAVTPELQDIVFDYVERRCEGEPIAYILGTKEFWSLDLKVTRDTLIPRPETEHLIEWALHYLPLTAAHIADLGTGSGAIAIALAHARPYWTVHASDASAAALNIAIHNAEQHRLTNIEFYLGSWYQALPSQRYTAIISNPPYIAADDPHLNHLSFEPYTALCAAEQGYAAFAAIIHDAKNYLLPGGKLILEHGYNQAAALKTMLQQAGFTHIDSYCDLSKHMRFVVAS